MKRMSKRVVSSHGESSHTDVALFSRPTQRTNYKLTSVVKKIYTGGKVHLCPDGTLASSAEQSVNFVDEGGCLVGSIVEQEDEISCFAVRPVQQEQEGLAEVVVATKSLQLKHYKGGKLQRSWKVGDRFAVVFTTSRLLGT
jgi:hypothetical protein